jgi:hypothetical protein
MRMWVVGSDVAPTLPHFVSSLPPEGANFSRGGPSKNCGLALPHFVSSLPPEGAAFCLGAAR